MAAGAGSSLIAVLVTDLVGSTEQRARLGEVTADELDRSVHAIASARVTEHGGRVVKGLGDGLLATFGAAADAVAAAIAIQQAVAAGHEVGLRVGVSVGDVAVQADGDVLGLPVVEAARLCAAAEPGQILVADVVRLLAHGRAGEVFRSVGALELKGIPTPMAASAVDWEPLPATRYPRPRPPVLAESEAFRFVGRNRELGALRRTLRRAEDGRRRVALVGGAPGIGKSRLIAEALRLQASRRTSTLVGRCRRGDTEPLGVFIDLLDVALEDWRASDLAGALGPAAGDAGRLVPSLAGRVGEGPAGAGPVDVVRRLLVAWAAEGPVFLVIEDAEWADEASRRLLLDLASAEQPDRFALVVSYDSTRLDGDAELASLVAELASRADCEAQGLEPLDDAEVEAIIEFAAGRSLDASDRADLAPVRHGAGGNPLYLSHFLRLLRDRGLLLDDGERVHLTRPLVDDDVPPGVPAVVAARIDVLPAPIRRVLARAAMGHDGGIDPDRLATTGAEPVREVLDALAVAERLDLVRPAERPGRFAFTHDLVCAAFEARPSDGGS